ncbi:hypothetical protein MJH12_09650 [bacterium]|nr:hypothetical protein [bacterium]
MNKFLFFFGILLLSFCNIACFSKKKKVIPPVVEIIDDFEEDLEDPIDLDDDENDKKSPSGFRTAEEKWEDFQYKSSYRTMDEMVFFAENIFHETPSKNIDRKMQLSFYLMEAFQKRKDNDNAKKYADHYKTFFKLKTGGKAFQKHQSMLKFKEKLDEHWSFSEE